MAFLCDIVTLLSCQHVSLLLKGKWAKGLLYVAVRNVEIGDSYPGPNVNNGPSRGIVTSALILSYQDIV